MSKDFQPHFTNKHKTKISIIFMVFTEFKMIGGGINIKRFKKMKDLQVYDETLKSFDGCST